MSALRFSVLVPTYRRPQLLRRNLEALDIQTRRPDEVLVSLRREEDPDGVATVAAFRASHPELPVVEVFVEEPGIVPAENALLAAASGDVACFLDDDSIARPFWLEKLAAHFEGDNRIGGVAGPAINVVDGRPQPARARHRNRLIWPGLILDQSTRHTDRAVGVDHFRGANMSLLIQPLRDAGGFDRRLLGDCFRFELDACLVVKAAGYRLLYDPEVEVDHHEAVRTGDAARLARRTVANNAANETYVLMKHFGWFGRLFHPLFAFCIGNFNAPGILWAVAGTLLQPIMRSRFLLGVTYLPAALRGRIRGFNLWLRAGSR